MLQKKAHINYLPAPPICWLTMSSLGASTTLWTAVSFLLFGFAPSKLLIHGKIGRHHCTTHHSNHTPPHYLTPELGTASESREGYDQSRTGRWTVLHHTTFHQLLQHLKCTPGVIPSFSLGIFVWCSVLLVVECKLLPKGE